MAKLSPFLQILLLTWFLKLTNGTDSVSNTTPWPETSLSSTAWPETASSSTPLPETAPNLTLWPDLSCHIGYLKDSQPGKENGETSLIQQIQNCDDEIKEMGDKSANCPKRCILEKLRILGWRVFEFRSELEIEGSLNDQFFPNHPHTGRKLAKQILESDCEQMLKTLAKTETKPSCQDQDEFFGCLEKAMQCK